MADTQAEIDRLWAHLENDTIDDDELITAKLPWALDQLSAALRREKRLRLALSDAAALLEVVANRPHHSTDCAEDNCQCLKLPANRAHIAASETLDRAGA